MIRSQPSSQPPALSLQTQLRLAFDRFQTLYTNLGGYRFHGWTTQGDPRNYVGPLIWSRSDLTFRFALELEREFPQQVHYTGAIVGDTGPTSLLGNGRPGSSIMVSDLSGLPLGAAAYEHLRRHQHLIMVEVHWFPKGRRNYPWEQHSRALLATVQRDLRQLEHAHRLEHCAVAAMLIIDDENYFEDFGDEISWPRSVLRLVCSPKQITRPKAALEDGYDAR